jgi:hypothetical protein
VGDLFQIRKHDSHYQDSIHNLSAEEWVSERVRIEACLNTLIFPMSRIKYYTLEIIPCVSLMTYPYMHFPESPCCVFTNLPVI